MNLKQYIELQKYIYDKHRFPRSGKCIKYIDITTDMRTGEIFSVNLRMFGNNEKHFRIYDEDSIKEIYEWLDSDKKI